MFFAVLYDVNVLCIRWVSGHWGSEAVALGLQKVVFRFRHQNGCCGGPQRANWLSSWPVLIYKDMLGGEPSFSYGLTELTLVLGNNFAWFHLCPGYYHAATGKNNPLSTLRR